MQETILKIRYFEIGLSENLDFTKQVQKNPFINDVLPDTV